MWAVSSIMLLGACTPTEAVTEEEITASSLIESSVKDASVATDNEESKENRGITFRISRFLSVIRKVPNPNQLYPMMAIH